MSIKKSKIKYIVGEIYTFTVKAILYDFCELRDEDNFAVYLQHTDKLRLVKGQKISCKVLANNEKRPKIELVQIEDTTEQEVLDANVVDEIIKPIATTWNTRVFSKLLMMREKDRSFEDECRSWIGLLNNAGCDLRQVRNDCTYFLEQTSFLSLCNAAEREFYQERLTMMIEFLGYYIKANQLLEEGEENTFIDNIFDKLTSSGFVYHPAKNFNIMSCLFLADRKLMEERMEKLFDIIRLWKTEVWGKEPFNSTLIKIIDLYVSENIWTVDRIKDNASLIANLIQALTIQLILIKQTDKDNETEYRLCLARLCLISSYLYNYNSSPKQTLGLALSNLLNVSCQVPLYTLQETKQKTVPYKICGMSPKPIDTTSCFIHGKGKLMISKSGIALYATQNEGEKPMMPSELNLWGQLQVLADKRSVRALPSKPSIMDCKNLWEDIEQDMFATKATPMVKVDSRKSHKVDEKVDIIITRQDRENPKLFHCRIDDKIGGEGTIRMDQIVPYGLEPEIGHFRSETGKNLVFEAVITDKDDDDNLQFSMLYQIKEWAEGYYDENEKMVCIMNADRPPQGKGKIPAVTKDGVSVQLGGFDEIEETNFKRGDLVIAVMQSEGTGSFHINCKVVEHYQGEPFYISSAFHKLMQEFAYADEEMTPSLEEMELQQSDNILDSSYVREIIRMIDRMSSTDNEYVNSYNYLGFARILCLMIGWAEQAAYYRGRMELILMLHDFAINDVVNQEKMKIMQQVNADIFRNDALLHSKFLQLQTVSYMGQTEHNQDLWDIYASQEGLVKEIASLVIAYNMVSEKNMKNLCNELQNRIKQTLRLKGYESNLKIYGSGIEDEKTEYKTSIVFPPNENMKPNMPKQMKNIKRVIASLLNTQGGTLYIGVNDSGAGVGIENDLEYSEFHGDKDKYQRTIYDAVIQEWGKLVATYVHIQFDHENQQKDILIVTVKPFSEGVSFEGKWLVRIGSSIREMKTVDFVLFNQKRATGIPTIEKNMLPIQPDNTPTTLEETSTKTIEKKAKPVVKNADEEICTSRWRKNTLEEYSDDYRPYIACFKFLNKGKFCKMMEYDYDPGILSLAVYDEETNAYLILGYDDGRIAKVPMDELLRYEDNRQYSRNTKAKLVFASIAQPEDAVVSITKEDKTKGRMMVRIDKLSEIEEDNLTGSGERLYKEDIGIVIGYEIAPADQLSNVEVLMGKNERCLGMAFSILSTEVKQQLSLWGINL